MAAPAPVVKEQDHKISCHQNRISFKGKFLIFSHRSVNIKIIKMWTNNIEFS